MWHFTIAKLFSFYTAFEGKAGLFPEGSEVLYVGMDGILILLAFHARKLLLNQKKNYIFARQIPLMTLDQLKQDLFEHFIRAFDEFNVAV
jgi:hypothetical protein